MTEFNPWISPLNRRTSEATPMGGAIEYEDFPCRSSRCNPSRNWQPTFNALKEAIEEVGLNILVQTAGCLEVCQLGPVVFYSGDRTWYARAKPDIAKRIVKEHLEEGKKIATHLYPSS